MELKITEALNQIEKVLEESKPVFLGGGKIAVDKNEIIKWIEELKKELPSELKRSIEIVEERDKILGEAKKESSILIEETQQTINHLIDQHEITKDARQKAQHIIEMARKDARDVQLGAIEHANEKLKEVEGRIKITFDTIHKEIGSFENFSSNVISTLQKEREEVRDLVSRGVHRT
ncbi:hypothetical protein AN639_05995 [Candidatus Epulonipiscium fishelsonii]|uniref:Uncharacterized protein n=1 Tax=Candidatus Epulonipiscium fishelsonii TaxID=77094 RepID=A0ACC8XE51_9FIRM|nr:hypothetical protein AN639_05995 [Epulopiscium sp. SCG-B05WGA-EpuloA1]ONI41063.1 hypothetical protein AN396_04750 [Epulopiscium sp. SCG-B11WGA-EpuloA1]